MLLMLFAVGFALRNWVALLLVTVPPFLALLHLIQVEERTLARDFVPNYMIYRHSTKRLIPAIYENKFQADVEFAILLIAKNAMKGH